MIPATLQSFPTPSSGPFSPALVLLFQKQTGFGLSQLPFGVPGQLPSSPDPPKETLPVLCSCSKTSHYLSKWISKPCPSPKLSPAAAPQSPAAFTSHVQPWDPGWFLVIHLPLRSSSPLGRPSHHPTPPGGAAHGTPAEGPSLQLWLPPGPIPQLLGFIPPLSWLLLICCTHLASLHALPSLIPLLPGLLLVSLYLSHCFMS